MKCTLSLIGFVSVSVWLSMWEPLTSAQVRERVILEEPGTSIRPRLLPDDEVVVIRRLADIDTVVPYRKPTLVQTVEYATYIHDAIVVMTPEREAGQLSADESWVETKIDGTIREVLKGSAQLREGQPMSVTYLGGGETTLGRTRVKAGTRFPVSAGKPCLMFMVVRPSGLIETSTLGIENGKLVSFDSSSTGKIKDSSSTGKNKEKMLWDGVSLARIAKLIRAAVEKQHKK